MPVPKLDPRVARHYITTKQAIQYLDVSRRVFNKHIKPNITAFKLDSVEVFKISELHAYDGTRLTEDSPK